MKKIISIIALAIMIVIPFNVKAAGDLSITHECTTLDASTRTKTCIFYMTTTGDVSLTKFSMNMTLKNLSIKSSANNAPWKTPTITPGEVSGEISKYNVGLQSDTPVKGTKQKIVTIVFEAAQGTTADDECSISYTPCSDETGTYTCGTEVITVEQKKLICKVENGKWYDKNGKEVTETEYNASCVTNPKTGNFLPYTIVGAGIVLIISVFAITRKNNKMYKI